ncbi:MAG: hypothetical protein ACP5J1_03245 [Fervidicoccaceae archaeon]
MGEVREMSKKTLRDFWKESEKTEEGFDSCYELEEKISKIEEKLEKIEKRLEKIEDLLEKMGEREGEKAIGIKEIEDAMRILKERGFIRESVDLSKTRRRKDIVERLKGLGAIEIRGSSDTYIVHPRKFEEFLKNIEEMRESDPVVVGDKLGEMKDLFNEMVRAGLVYFDVKERKWKTVG